MSQLYSDLDSKQRAILYPMLGYLHRNRDTWRVLAQGRFYRQVPLNLSKRLLMRGLQRVMNVPRHEFQEELFRQRLEGFLVAAEPGRRVVLQLGQERVSLRKKTRSSGLFQSTFDVPSEVIRSLVPNVDQQDCRIDVKLAVDPQLHESLEVTNSLFLVAPRGLSVISDIDDTIKRTQVTQKRAMLANTFVHPFQPIEGMAKVYQQWEKQGVFFHYVSSSPWQLYSALDDFFALENFPAGSMHLRWFRLRDEILRKWQILRRRGKYGIIANLLKRFPEREFVLLGDSGERDPEIYARLAKRFSSQVKMIALRQIPDRLLEGKRWQKIEQTARKIPCLTFESPHELPSEL